MKEGIGILGTKLGNTHLYNDDGRRVPVTVVAAGPMVVVQKKTMEKDGYTAIQVGFGSRRGKVMTLPERGHLRAAGQGPGPRKGKDDRAKDLKKEAAATYSRDLREFRLSQEDLDTYEVGQEIRCDVFEAGMRIDVTGISKGKGFAGVIKRHHMKGTRATHGTHECFRHGGSIGQKEFPAKVWKGHKMAGQLGNKQITVQNVAIVRVDTEDNLILLEGGVPGGKRTTIMLHPGSKAKIKAV